jgi:hypothetical protein
LNERNEKDFGCEQPNESEKRVRRLPNEEHKVLRIIERFARRKFLREQTLFKKSRQAGM